MVAATEEGVVQRGNGFRVFSSHADSPIAYWTIVLPSKSDVENAAILVVVFPKKYVNYSLQWYIASTKHEACSRYIQRYEPSRHIQG